MDPREEIYITYREKVLAYLRSHVERWEDAEDLCGDVFEQIYRSLPRFDETKASLSTWIYHITRHILIKHIQRKRPWEPLDEALTAADGLEDTLIRDETLERLAKALAGLDHDQRDIIILRYFRNHTLTEIARLTHISYGMVKVKHKKALATLRRKLE